MTFSRFCIFCALVPALLLTPASTSHASLDLWTEDPNIKVRPGAVPGANRFITLKAAKNEYEPFQIVVYDDEGGSLQQVTASATDLEGPDGGAIEAGNISLYRVHLIEIKRGSHKPERESDLGFWPDALIPFTDVYYGEQRNGAPFDVPAGEIRSIWVDVYVPADAAAGDYNGTVTVSAEGSPAIEVPVTLTVWDFNLPGKITVESSFGWSCSGCASGHERLGSTIPDRKALGTLYLKEALKHRMTLRGFDSCASLPYTYDAELDRIVFDWSEHDAFVTPALDGALMDTGAEFTSASLPRPNLSDHQKVLYWRAYAEHYREKGWLEKLYLYLPDEPTPDQYPDVAHLADLLHEADPDLRAMVTEQLAEPLFGHIDIWCPDVPYFSDTFPTWPNPEDYPLRQALGEEVWWYNCMSVQFVMDWPNYFIDSQGLYARVFAWMTRKFGFTGILYWHTLYAWNQSGKDPWENQYEARFWCNGDGTLFYPGTPGKIGGTTDIPVSSIRMKMIREGMEDYEYFHILDEMGEEAFVNAEVGAFATKSWIWSHDSTRLFNIRERMAQRIVGAPTVWSAASGQASSLGRRSSGHEEKTLNAALSVLLVGLAWIALKLRKRGIRSITLQGTGNPGRRGR